MEHLTILASSEGQWVLPGTSEFFAALGDPDPDYDAMSFAVRNLGFVKFEVIRQSIIEIELHPRNIELPALLAVQQQLLSSDLRLFRIKYFDDELAFRDLLRRPRRRSRACPSCAGRISCPRRTSGFSSSRRISECCSRTRTTRSAGSRRNGAFRSGISTRTSSRWRCAASCCRGSRLLASSRDRRIRYGALSATGMAGWERKTFTKLIGERVANIPDKDYGEWASACYRSVAEFGRPRYDLVSTSVQYLNAPGKPWRPVRYERLVLPWKTPSEEIFVTLCSRRIGGGASAKPPVRLGHDGGR